MRKQQAIKGSIGVFALMFAASLLLLLPGCQGPLGLQGTDPDTGTVQLTLEMPPVGRAILPTITLADFDYFRLAFTPAGGGTAIYGEWERNAAGDIDGEVTLPEGTWNLVVTAYLTWADYDDSDKVLFSGPPISVEVSAGATVTIDPIELRPVPLIGVDGTFTWNVTFPGGTATLTVRDLSNATVGTPPIASGVGGSLSLPVGSYNVLVRVVDGGNVAILGKPLHVLPYHLMPSHLDHEFEASHFRPLVSDTLGGFISRTGNWWTADNQPGWVGTAINEGEFSPGDELHLAGLDAAEWVNNDGALALRVTGRAARGHGVDLRVGGLGLVAGDTITVTGRAIGPAVTPDGSPGRVIAANVNLGDWEPIGQSNNLGAGVLDHAAFTLTANFAGQATDAVRIQSNAWNLDGAPPNDGIHTFYITGIAIYRPTPIDDPVYGVLGDFITLTGLLAGSTFDWLDAPIEQGDFVPVGPLVSTGGPAAWVVRNDDYLSLRHDGPAAAWSGIDILTSVLPLQVGDVITVYIRGLPVGVTLNGDRSGWQNLAQVNLTGVDTPVRLRGTVNEPTAAASGPRIQIGEAAGVFYVDSIEIYRPDYIPTPQLAGTLELITRAETDIILFDLQDALASMTVGQAPTSYLAGHGSPTVTIAAGPAPAQQRYVVTSLHSADNQRGVTIAVSDFTSVVAGDTIRIRGRVAATHAGSGNGRIALFNPGATADANIIVESGFGTAPSMFLFTHVLTATDISQGLIIQANFWGTPPGQAGFFFSVDDMTVSRPDPDAGPPPIHARLPGAPGNLDAVRADNVGNMAWDMRDLDAAELTAHFAGLNNRMVNSVHTVGGQTIVVSTDAGSGSGGDVSTHDSMNGGWAALTVIRPSMDLAMNYVLHITGRIGNDGVAVTGTPGQMGLRFESAWPAMISTTPDNALPATFTIAHPLTAAEADGTIEIRWNLWGLNPLPATFAISIDDMVIVSVEAADYEVARADLLEVINTANLRVLGGYTTGTWTPFASALAAANTAMAYTNVDDIDAARETLSSTLSALVIDANPAWAVVLASPYVTAVTGGAAAWNYVTSVAGGLLVHNRGANNQGFGVDIVGLRAAYPGSAPVITVTGRMSTQNAMMLQGFPGNIQGAVTEPQGTFTVTIPATGDVSIPGWADWATTPWITNADGILGDFLVTGIQVGTLSIQDLLATDVPSGEAGLNISFDDLRNRIAPITHTVPLSDVVGSTIGAPTDGFTDHTWSHNLAVIHSGPTLTLDASFARAGRHLVTLRANYGGRTYSQIVEITVTP